MKRAIVFFCFMLFVFPVMHWAGPAPSGPGEAVKVISQPVVEKVTARLLKMHGEERAELIRKGVSQAANLWRKNDGGESEFESFCLKQYIGDETAREQVFHKISDNSEALKGHFGMIQLQLKWKMQIDEGKLHPLDLVFAGYDPGTHMKSDFYRNKIAFITVLNFPFYSLAEKQRLGPGWTRLQWAYARLGDEYKARIPAELLQRDAEVYSAGRAYIADYNIYMGHLLDKDGKKLFPKDLVLLSHWNLRDELKSHYTTAGGMEKQLLIYEVMKRIVTQDIPQKVINSGQYDWNPYTGKTYEDGKEVKLEREPDARYRQILDAFLAKKAMGPYYPPSLRKYIQLNYETKKEVSHAEVEELFVKFLTAPQVKKVAALIRKRLKRDLLPFDIWYNGFGSAGSIPEEKLDTIVRERYPTAAHLKKDLERILLKIGFSTEKAGFLAAHTEVNDARGSGHARGPEMKGDKAYLRTRVPDKGMNYKGYNIAIHEFGHNVEQLISMYDVDYFTLNGVPNTAMTEALAYVFQKRDLYLLGIEAASPDKKHLEVLENFWDTYEMMGVSLIELKVWEWLEQNPDATAATLKGAVLQAAKDVWNRFYAPVLGGKDKFLMAIYSHMVHHPLYLSNYALGHLVDFQMGRYLEGKDLAKEVERIFALGKLTPQLWMKQAVGEELSGEPLLNAVDEALKHIK